MLIRERKAQETAREYALRVLRENIISLEMEPGSRVNENELTALLGISRTPVREALMELSRIKIVEIYPQRGSYISLMDYESVEEARFIRLALEKEIMELVCQNVTDEQIKQLEENIKLQQFYIDNENWEKLLETDNEFHRILFVIANKMQAYTLMNSMMIYFDRMRSLRLKVVKNQYIVDDHRRILEAIQEKNAGRAAKIVGEHLTRHEVDWSELRKEHPEYFK
ncbi:MAG: GntR family transcriptional regulator [Eubacteriales bacterium]|nr:GntR family transcriptional regulator [Eubacteriales bacterium]